MVFRRLKALFVEDLGLWMVAIVGAAVIWFFVNEELTDVRTLSVAVKIRAPVGRAVTPGTVVVAVTVRGPRGKVSSLSAGDLAGAYDIPRDVKDARVAVELREEHFSLPTGGRIHITKIDPPSLTVAVTETYSRQMRVQVMPRGAPAKGFESVGAEAFPGLVTVTGPQAGLEGVEVIRTKPVDITGRTGTVSLRVGVAGTVDGPDGPVEVSCAERVTATVTIRPKLAERSIENVPIRTLRAPAAAKPVKIEPAALTVRVSGERRAVVGLTAADVLLFVDLTGGLDGGEVPVRLKLPAGVGLAAGFALPNVNVRALAEGGGQ